MGYCTIDDLKKAIDESVLIRLTDDEGNGAVNTGRAQEGIDSAGEEIDLYLGKRAALPIVGTVPSILSKLAADIAIYNLYSRVKESIPETRSERYKNAVNMLSKIAEGKITLGLQPPPDPPSSGEYAGAARTNTRTKVFDEDTLNKW